MGHRRLASCELNQFVFQKGKAMPLSMSHRGVRAVSWLGGWALVTTALVMVGRVVIPPDSVSHDFICYWSTGKILISGGSPYDPKLQTRVQTQYGWDKETSGDGIWDYAPYYYPPSLLAPICVLPIALGYPTAKIAWLVINTQLLFVSGYLLHKAVPDVPRSVPLLLVPFFAFSGISVLIGQLAALVLFLFVLTLRLLQIRWERAAGCLLAWIMIKPQLSVLLVPATLFWAVRERRWRVVTGFVTGLAVLLVVTTVLIPTWPAEFIRLHTSTPVPTVERPWKGATWPLLLRTLGLSGIPLWFACLAVAVPLLSLLARSVFDRRRSLEEIYALSILVPFFLVPYGRTYDFPVLLIPLIVLLAGRLPDLWGAVILFVILVAPLFHWWWIGNPHHVSFFWIPMLLMSAWLTWHFRLGGLEWRQA